MVAQHVGRLGGDGCAGVGADHREAGRTRGETGRTHGEAGRAHGEAGRAHGEAGRTRGEAGRTRGAASAAAKYGPGVYAHITTEEGVMIARLFAKDAPLTVENFVGLAEGKKAWRNPRTGMMVRRPYYNGLTFHRIIPGFMIQGGDPEGSGRGGAGFTWVDEFNPALRHNKPGILSMANAGPTRTTASSSSRSCRRPIWTTGIACSAELVEGLDVLQAIGKVPTSKADSRPLKPVIMKSVRIERVS